MSGTVVISVDPALANPTLSQSMKELSKLVANKTNKSTEVVSAMEQPFDSDKEHKYLLAPSGGIDAKIHAVIKEAQNTKASVIVAGTQIKTGSLRGGFVEKLIHASPIPVIVLTPKTKVPHKIRKLLFATDLGKGSMAIFKKLCSFAQECEAEIKIVHALSPDQRYLLESSTLLSTLPPELILERMAEHEEQMASANAEQLLSMARKNHLKASVEIQPYMFSRSQVILSVASQWNPDLIAMGSGGAGTLRGHLFGSTSISLISSSPRPLWIYHEKS